MFCIDIPAACRISILQCKCRVSGQIPVCCDKRNQCVCAKQGVKPSSCD